MHMDCEQRLSAGADRQQKCGLRDLWTEAQRLEWKHKEEGYIGISIAR